MSFIDSHAAIAFTKVLFFSFFAVVLGGVADTSSADPHVLRPNIVIFIADDLGLKDLGYRGSDIMTPALDSLARSGTQLDRFYALQVCTPTRSALMTGLHPIRIGMQRGPLAVWSNFGLPLSEVTLAQELKKAGYSTAIVGKWHLGILTKAYLPTRRGFDHQYGPYLGYINYFSLKNLDVLDWHRNDMPAPEYQNKNYATTLLADEATRLIGEQDFKKSPLFLYMPFNAPHEPLQAPESYIAKYAHINDPKRRVYAAMITALDDAVARVVSALRERNQLDNTLIFFSGDNGGDRKVGANLGKLRGQKDTLYEGGLRVPAFISWKNHIASSQISSKAFHIVDIFPTIMNAAGATYNPNQKDGKDIVKVLNGRTAPHDELLLNILRKTSAILKGDWKLVYNGPLPTTDFSAGPTTELYDLKSDPNEHQNLAMANQLLVAELIKRLNFYAGVTQPALDNYVWGPAN